MTAVQTGFTDEPSRYPLEMHHPGPFPLFGQLLPFLRLIERSGCVVAASDTCYGVFCAATDPKAVSLVRKVSGSVDPLPVTVGSVAAAAKLVQLTDQHEGFLSKLWPGAFTAVAAPAWGIGRKIARHVNEKDGTIGVRVTAGEIEVALHREMEVALVSTAVRYDDGTPVRVTDDARRIVSFAMTKFQIPERDVVFVPYDGFRWPTHSTVGRMTNTPDLVQVLREGVYSVRRLQEIVRAITMQQLAPNVIAPFRSTTAMRSWLDDPTTLGDVT